MAKDLNKLLNGFNSTSEFMNPFPEEQSNAEQAAIVGKRGRGRPLKDTKQSDGSGGSIIVRLDREVVLRLDYLVSKTSMERGRRISRSEYLNSILPDIK